MFGASTPNNHPDPGDFPRSFSQVDLSKHQETIYEFLLEIVKSWHPDRVLEHFRNLFVYQIKAAGFPAIQALQSILLAGDQEVFHLTLKRSCYILVNNWETARHYSHIQELVQGLKDPIIYKSSFAPTTRRLRAWIIDFVESEDYQDLKLFAERFKEGTKPWYHRYDYYLLVSQYENQNNPIEQREAARGLSEQVKRRFKLDLAMYVAHSQLLSRKPLELPELKPQSPRAALPYHPYENPTELGDRTLQIIKLLVLRTGQFSYENLAKIFVNQVQDLPYRPYKLSLLKYLLFSDEKHANSQKGFITNLKQQLSLKLKDLYPEHDQEDVDEVLRFRTCKQVINFLTTEDDHHPATLFTSILFQGGMLTLAIILLKLVLVCPGSRNHLDIRIAHLVQYYKPYAPEDCQWFSYFLDVLNVTFAIYTEGVEYNLLELNQNLKSKNNSSCCITPTSHPLDQSITEPSQSLEQYTIFSQIKGNRDAHCETESQR